LKGVCLAGSFTTEDKACETIASLDSVTTRWAAQYMAAGRAIHGCGPRRNGILDNDRRTGR